MDLTMRPPSTSDIILAQKLTTSPEDKDVALYAALTETTGEVIESLSWFDYLQLENAFALFQHPLSVHLEKRALLLDVKPETATAEQQQCLPTS